jgi:hypothetical protein
MFGVFLTKTVGVIDKIKKRLFDVKFLRRHKRYYGKNSKKYILYSHGKKLCSFLYKKNWNFRPIILGNMDILKKREVIGNLGKQILLQLR